MSYPYGKRERLKIIWEDACHSSNMTVKKGTVVFEGSPRHCLEQAIKWFTQNGFGDAVDVWEISWTKLDIKLYGRVWHILEGMLAEKKKAEAEQKAQPVVQS